MFRVVTWKWKPPPQYRSQYTAEHVNTLASMVSRNIKMEYEFCCATDDPTGIDSSVRIIPLWDDYADVPNPSSDKGPSCYRRLKAFSEEAKDLIGDRFVSIDLDTVITGDVTPLWDRPDDFIIWGDTERDYHKRFIARIPRHMHVFQRLYNGSMWMLRAGTRQIVWQRFDPAVSPGEAIRHGRHGSDQGWISHVLGPGEKVWTTHDGVYSYRNHLKQKNGVLPEDARMVCFHGHVDPWSSEVSSLDWIRKHYR